jgi:hypothetical protein
MNIKVTLNDVVVFKTLDSDPEFQKYNGMTAVVKDIIAIPDSDHDQEALPMYIIWFPKNNETIEAFDDEINIIPEI